MKEKDFAKDREDNVDGILVGKKKRRLKRKIQRRIEKKMMKKCKRRIKDCIEKDSMKRQYEKIV